LSPARDRRKAIIHAELREYDQAEVPAVVPSLSEPGKSDDLPPDLTVVVAAWPRLTAAIKSAILTLAQTAGGVDG
jgi:hypothetical protein